jgi:3-hydroxyisobutyrate dehydrogenase-like beta-hydroxyacid dehydrogenase
MFWIRQKNAVFSCTIYQNYGREILDKNYTEPLFKLQPGLKDIRLIVETATESNTLMRFAGSIFSSCGLWPIPLRLDGDRI